MGPARPRPRVVRPVALWLPCVINYVLILKENEGRAPSLPVGRSAFSRVRLGRWTFVSAGAFLQICVPALLPFCGHLRLGSLRPGFESWFSGASCRQEKEDDDQSANTKLNET